MRALLPSRVEAFFVAAQLMLGLVLLSPVFIAPDAVATYSWLRSAVFDHDFLFFNEWAMFGLIQRGVTLFKVMTALGTLANHWGIGTSLVAAPFYLVIRVAAWLYGVPAQAEGLFGIYGLGLAWITVAFGAVILLLLRRMIQREGGTSTEIWVALAGLWLGTPLFYYQYRLPLGTHLFGALWIALVCWVLQRHDEENPRLAAAGFALGLGIATRLQHVVLIPAIIWWLWRRRVRPRDWLRFAAAMMPGLVCQWIAWQIVYGSPAGPVIGGANPAGPTWAAFDQLAFGRVLFSSFHGLLPWSPVLALAIAGWVWRIRRGSRLAEMLALMFLMELIANSTFDRYWWGGSGFGGRRFVDLAVPFGMGIFWFLSAIRKRVALPLVGTSVLWSAGLMVSAATGRLGLASDVAPAELIRAAFEGLTFRGVTTRTLNGPLFHPQAVPAALISLGCVVAVLLVLFLAARVDLVRIGTIWLTLCGVGMLLIAASTRSKAAGEIARFSHSAAEGDACGAAPGPAESSERRVALRPADRPSRPCAATRARASGTRCRAPAARNRCRSAQVITAVQSRHA